MGNHHYIVCGVYPFTRMIFYCGSFFVEKAIRHRSMRGGWLLKIKLDSFWLADAILFDVNPLPSWLRGFTVDALTQVSFSWKHYLDHAATDLYKFCFYFC